MLHLVQLDRSYSPETISVMTAAFDMVCQSVSKRMNGSDDVKKTLALMILRQRGIWWRSPSRSQPFRGTFRLSGGSFLGSQAEAARKTI